jgi:hypothetical protein
VTEPEVYLERIGDILGDAFVNGKLQLSLDVSSVDDAKVTPTDYINESK